MGLADNSIDTHGDNDVGELLLSELRRQDILKRNTATELKLYSNWKLNGNVNPKWFCNTQLFFD